MLKQTYTDEKEEAINFTLRPHNYKCEKCQKVRLCNPDDYRVESGEFCSPEDYIECPLVKMMGADRALADEMEYQDTFEKRELLSVWKENNMFSNDGIP